MNPVNTANILNHFEVMTSPPPGSVNVKVGKVIVGPGGKWVPCATMIGSGVFCSGLFEVGHGKRQVCAVDTVLKSADEALSRAINLAYSAAA